MTWNASKPAMANQVSADIPDIEENFAELEAILEAITNGTLGTTAAADFRVDVGGMAVNSVDSDQYVDGSIDKVHLSADCIDGDKIEDDAIDSEHYTDGSIDLAHMSAESVDSDQYVDGSIDPAHLANNSVETAKINNAAVDKDKLNTDVVGAGLAGGAGTALSVDGIVEAGSAEMKMKVVTISDWDMNFSVGGAASKSVAHGLTLANIKSVDVLILNDAESELYPLGREDTAENQGGYDIDGTNVIMTVIAASLYDNAAFDDTPGPRGSITIWYAA